MKKNNSLVSRYVASRYTKSTYAVWDTVKNRWANGPAYGTKKEAETAAEAMTESGQVDHGSEPSDDINQYLPQ